MSRDTDTVLTAYVVESQTTITLGHLCRSCGVHAEWVQQLVAEGVLEPAAIGERERWAFSADSVPRVLLNREKARLASRGARRSRVALDPKPLTTR